jgi:hypothetical protein
MPTGGTPVAKTAQWNDHAAETDSLEERIRRRAHEIYLERTVLQTEQDDWFQAELEIRLAEEHREITRNRQTVGSKTV